MKDTAFAILAHLVEEKTGIHHGAHDRDIFLEKVRTRAREAGFESLLDYYYLLRYDDRGGAELDALIDALVVGETYLFREEEALRVAIEQVIAPMVASGRRARCWSAACATGEEPFTLAMLLEEAGVLGRVDIVASDISLSSLARACSGQLSPRSMRALPARAIGRWVQNTHVVPHIVGAVEWKRINLVDQKAIAALGTFDLILCRNVLIYFDDQTVVGVVRSLAEVMNQGGALLIGASESLLRFGTLLACEERGGVFFYRRRPS
jgi:chemotaxis protein methyltransferase CheR